ncbi:MAG: hypothetical protein JOZ99_01425 [Actinobacteria bacterium]|nr:hypothetical protein [Actinomycetota bacterium]
MLTTRTRDSCGSSGCEIELLTSERLDAPDDPVALYELSLQQGWGDGLPVLPPTEARVRALIGATPWLPDDVVCTLPPRNGTATVERVAVNAAVAGCERDGFPLVIAALEAVTVPDFNLFALTTTTSSVFPMIIVNGPTRERLGIDCGPGCMGGAAGRGSTTIGRALALCLRNIGGQRVGETSRSVFGQPARVTGLCFGELEEESPWPSLAVRRGFSAGDEVVTVHGGKGTFPIADLNTDDPRELLALIAKTIAYPMGNKFLEPTAANGQIVVTINPVWAARLARAFPDVSSAQEHMLEHAWQPVDAWPARNQAILEEKGRVDARGRVHVNERPDQFELVVCGGHGGLHAVCLPSWGESDMQSVAAVRAGDVSVQVTPAR